MPDMPELVECESCGKLFNLPAVKEIEADACPECLDSIDTSYPDDPAAFVAMMHAKYDITE